MNIINTSGKINIDAENIKILYKHYKAFLVPIGVILVSILAIIYIIFPQVQQYFNSQSLVVVEQQKLNTIKANYSLLTSLDDAQIAANLKILSQALPPQKDFAGIIDAIAYVSAKTGVSVGNFEFSLGDLSASNFAGTAYPSTKLNINLKGDAKSITNFSNEIVKTMPISEVTSINISQNVGILVVIFYYKPFPPKNFSDQDSITLLSGNQESLIKQVSAWNSAASGESLAVPSVPATVSANLSGSPF